MPDQQNNSGVVVGGSNGGDIAQAIAQAVAAAVSTSIKEISAKLDSMSENIKKQSLNEDQDVTTQVTGAYDEYDNKRLADASNHRVMVLAEQALANAVEIAKGVGMRSLDHFGSLPPVSAKPSGC